MSAPPTILGVFAHPDDESMGPGATFAKYAAAGHRVAFVTATDGGAGRMGPERPETEQGRATLRATRRAETVAAAKILGADFLGFLDYDDGTLATRNVLEIEETIASILRRERPDIVVTFHGSGISYHPDHRVITLATMGAVLGSGRELWYRNEELQKLPPHTVPKLYTFVPSSEAAYWRDWPREIYAAAPSEITTVVDTKATAAVKWAAIEAHASQQYGPPFRKLWEAGAFAEEYFVRVFPGGGPSTPLETDLFEGLD